MNQITTIAPDDAVVFLADALSRERALTETESRLLHRSMRRNHGAFRRWTPEDDRKLLRMSKARIRCTDMARVLNRTEATVYQRLSRLRKMERVGG